MLHNTKPHTLAGFNSPNRASYSFFQVLTFSSHSLHKVSIKNFDQLRDLHVRQ